MIGAVVSINVKETLSNITVVRLAVLDKTDLSFCGTPVDTLYTKDIVQSAVNNLTYQKLTDVTVTGEVGDDPTRQYGRG